MNENVYKIFLKFSYQTGIHIKKILDFFYLVSKIDNLTNSDLTTLTGLSRRSIVLIEKEFYSYFKHDNQYVQLSDKAKLEISHINNQDYIIEEKYYECISSHQAEINDQITKIGSKRLPPERDYDQFLATTETLSRRALLMSHLLDIDFKRILFIGDDDFTSQAIQQTGTPELIKVVDIDKRILQTLKTTSKQVKTEEYDAKIALPNHLRNSYDVVFTDPPYTTEGFELFLSRAVQALDIQNKSARIYICYGNSDLAKEKYIPIYRAIIKSGLKIAYLLPNFNKYVGADSIGNSSDLIICELTPTTRAMIKGNYKDNIYTGQKGIKKT